MVIITGPNTGGKTVALKTLGLLSLMSAAGLHIPAGETSAVPLYTNVFADIGDEQSIEQSLSTFSSHMTRIIEILRLAGPQSLVLLDELGAGTDPEEGSALAKSILLELLQNGVECVATTHYSELKTFAHEQDGVVNASVEFNIETLSPTYHLTIGLPGRSNALAIASRLGLSDNIVQRARAMSDTVSIAMEDLLTEIQKEKAAIQQERLNAEQERRQAELFSKQAAQQQRQLETERRNIETERIRILNEARSEARRETEKLRAEFGRVRAALKHPGADEDQIEKARARYQRIIDATEQLPEPVTPLHYAAPETPEAEEDVPQVMSGTPEIGDYARVKSINKIGQVISKPDNKNMVEIVLGSMHMRAALSDIERVSRRQTAASAVRQKSVYRDFTEQKAPAAEIDLRGKTVDDTLIELETYLHDAFLGNLYSVRIIHGKGTGQLRLAVRDFLKKSPYIKSFETPAYNQGGDGVTIAVMNV